ncbi:MAG: hypothetical protein ACMUHB_00830, partial [Thermoplasmatota archaeon]
MIRRGLSLYPKRMSWVEVFLMGSDLKRVVDRLHEARVFQVVNRDNRKELAPDPSLLDLKNRLDKIIELLSPLEFKKKGILASFLHDRGNELVVPDSDMKGHLRKWLIEAEKEIEPVQKELGGIEEDMNYIRDMKDRLVQLAGLDVDLGILSSFRLVRAKVGTTRRFAELRESLGSTGADIDGSLLDKKEGIHSVRILYSSSNSFEVEGILRGRLFTEVSLDIPKLRAFLKRTTGNDSDLGLSILHLVRSLENVEEGIKKMKEKALEKASEL